MATLVRLQFAAQVGEYRVQIFTRLLEGPYPNYEQVIPRDNPRELQVRRKSGDVTVIDAKPSRLEAYAIGFKLMREPGPWGQRGRACGMRGGSAVLA